MMHGPTFHWHVTNYDARSDLSYHNLPTPLLREAAPYSTYGKALSSSVGLLPGNRYQYQVYAVYEHNNYMDLY